MRWDRQSITNQPIIVYRTCGAPLHALDPPNDPALECPWLSTTPARGRLIALALEGLQARLDALHFAFVAFAFRFLPLLLQNADQVISLTHLE